MCIFSVQTLKYSSKGHPGGDHRHEKMREASDVTPPCKMLRRSDSPENKHTDGTGHSRAKAVHTHRARDRDGGETWHTTQNVVSYLLPFTMKHFSTNLVQHLSSAHLVIGIVVKVC